MDPELLAKLSQRLRAVEGHQAQARGNTPAAPCQQGHRMGRVQVPHWVIRPTDAEEGSRSGLSIRVKSPRRFSRGVSSSSSTHAEPQSLAELPSCMSAEARLRRELARLEQERDLALEAAASAEASALAWNEHLNAEAVHLRHLCSSMADDQNAVRGQVSVLRERAHSDHGSEAADPQEELSILHGDVTDLTEQLSELRAQRTSLQASVSTLRQELSAQLAEEAELRRLLDEANGCNQPSSSSSSSSSSQCTLLPPRPPKLTPPVAGSAPRSCATSTPLSPRMLPQASPVHRRSEMEAHEEEEYDIEFAYDMGLEMSTRMSVPRVMKLAKAASRLQPVEDQDETEEEEAPQEAKEEARPEAPQQEAPSTKPGEVEVDWSLYEEPLKELAKVYKEIYGIDPSESTMHLEDDPRDEWARPRKQPATQAQEETRAEAPKPEASEESQPEAPQQEAKEEARPEAPQQEAPSTKPGEVEVDWSLYEEPLKELAKVYKEIYGIDPSESTMHLEDDPRDEWARPSSKPSAAAKANDESQPEVTLPGPSVAADQGIAPPPPKQSQGLTASLLSRAQGLHMGFFSMR